MTKVIFVLTLVLVTFSFTNSGKVPNDDAKKADETRSKDDMSEMPDMSTEGQNDKDQENTINAELIAAMRDCNDSFRIEISYLEALNESGSFPDETEKTPKCYVRCVLETTAVASDDGKFNAARAAEVFAGERGGKPMDDLEEMATACSDRKESCKCERSYQFMKCLMEMEIMKYEKNQ